MSAAPHLRQPNIFEPVEESELQALYARIYTESPLMVGRSTDGTIITFKPMVGSTDYLIINGAYRSVPVHWQSVNVTFSFTLNESKFLFKAVFRRKDHRQGVLNLLTTLYRIQRRSVKRLKIPTDYYAVVRLSYQNSRMIRSFGKLMDISPRGVGIFLPKDEQGIKVGDHLRLVLTISQRPPENIEIRVIHTHPHVRVDEKAGEKSEGIFLGAICLPEHSLKVFKRMNAIVMDIYRDLFGAVSDDMLKSKG